MQNDDFEARLKSLSPVSGRMDAVTAAYAAGRRSSVRSLNRWRGVAAVVAMAAVLPWMMPKSKPAAVVHPSVAISAESFVVKEAEPILAGNIWQLRQAVLEKGLDGLPPVQVPAGKPMRASDLF